MSTTSPDRSSLDTGGSATISASSRRLGRARSRRLLITLFGDHWQPGQDPVASAGLVRILEEFAITPANARAALSRLTQQGMLERHRKGRRTSYSLTDDASRILARGARRIFAEEDGQPWDGTWTLVAFSVPGGDGDLRRLLRARLRWLTFWPLYDGGWVTPHDRGTAVEEQLAELGIDDALIVRTRNLELRHAAEARLRALWNLPALSRDYEDYLARYAELYDDSLAGRVAPPKALVQRIELVDDWRRLIRDDPDLPSELLPEPFPRRPARERFLRTYRALEQPARQRFEELIHADGRSG